MPRDPLAYLRDARRAVARIIEFVDGRSWVDYEADAMVRSAVERQFEIVGDAKAIVDKLWNKNAAGTKSGAGRGAYRTMSVATW